MRMTLSAIQYVYIEMIYLHMECLSKYSVTIATVGLFFFFFSDGQWEKRMSWFSSPYGKYCISVHRYTLRNVISPIIFLPHNILFQERAKGLDSRAFSIFSNWEDQNKLVTIFFILKQSLFMQPFLKKKKKRFSRILKPQGSWSNFKEPYIPKRFFIRINVLNDWIIRIIL